MRKTGETTCMEVVYGGDKNSGKKKRIESNGINGAWGSEPNLDSNQRRPWKLCCCCVLNH